MIKKTLIIHVYIRNIIKGLLLDLISCLIQYQCLIKFLFYFIVLYRGSQDDVLSDALTLYFQEDNNGIIKPIDNTTLNQVSALVILIYLVVCVICVSNL